MAYPPYSGDISLRHYIDIGAIYKRYNVNSGDRTISAPAVGVTKLATTFFTLVGSEAALIQKREPMAAHTI
jgi:hypothetical protein